MKDSRYQALIPFGIFLCIFIALNIIYNSSSITHDNFPIFAAVAAIIASLFTFQKNETWNEKIEIFIQGSTQSMVIHMCYIFYVSTVFTTILEHTGGIAAAVNISLFFIPTCCVLPGIFIVSSLFSFTVGTSMGAIAAFMPIAVKIASHVSLNPSMMAATIVCGSMFGDNLSILSDTTIAAVKITHSSMKEKLRLNAIIAAPAFLISLIILTYQNYLTTSTINITQQAVISNFDIIKVLPYLTTFYLALTGLDILIVLTIGIIFAVSIGIWLQSLTLLQSINLIFDGFYASKGMVNVFILVLLLAGLSRIISHNGGIEYLIDKLQHKIKNIYQAKIVIFFLITAVNITIAINTISILITGPIATKISDDYNIDSSQTACILDIASCVSQGLLPYAPQLLLAASMAQVSAVSLLPYLYYQYFLAISLFAFIAWNKK
ncbi:MAG: Na+/H+ antiporter NhaC family protein [Candidatus Chromulinivorax sp.]|nr:Na+/H+ antiporter NhaC family protein [Candidatus Chromulinivorax sp.]